MKMSMQACGIALAAALLSAPVTTLHAESQDAVKAQLVKLTQELMDALIPGKADVWQRILADDAVIVDEFGRLQSKADAVKSIHPFPAGFAGTIEIRDPQVRVYGDAAILQGEFYEKETVFDQKLLVRYIFSNTFVRRGGEWKLVAATDVTLPTPPPVLAVGNLRMDDYPGVYRYGPSRAFTVAIDGGKLYFTTKPGRPRTSLDPIAKDVFMDGGDEKNLLIFRRDASGQVTELIERRKFNDLHMLRSASNAQP